MFVALIGWGLQVCGARLLSALGEMARLSESQQGLRVLEQKERLTSNLEHGAAHVGSLCRCRSRSRLYAV